MDVGKLGLQFGTATTMAVVFFAIVAFYTELGLIGYVVAAFLAGSIGRYLIPMRFEKRDADTAEV